MTDDASEGEEMPEMLAIEDVAEVRILDLPG
jgi:hypothetical protein